MQAILSGWYYKASTGGKHHMAKEAQQPASARARPSGAFSIRLRLMVLALIAIVPLVLERVHNEQFDRSERIDAAHKEVLDLARRAAAAQNDVIVSTRALLQVLAGSRAVSDPSDPVCGKLLKGIAEPDPWIRALSVANLAGRIVCSSSPVAVDLDISRRPHFIDALKTGQFTVSNYFMGTRDKNPLIIAAFPRHKADGSVESVVLATLDLDWIGQIAATLAARPGAIMLVVDGKGTVLAHEPNPENKVGRHLADHPFVKEMMTHGEGVTEASLDGRRRIFGYVELPGTSAHVAFGFDESEVLSRVDSAMWLAFAELGGVTLLVLLSIWFGAERLLVRPIRLLAEAAARIGRGEDKMQAAKLPWASEFVPLAVALDDMAEKLEAREQELRDLNAQLRELAQLDPLTSLANRRTFNAQLQTEWKAAAKRRQPISVLMIDVDNFKPFNDRYGHVQGDACLRKVGELLKSFSKGRADFVAAAGDTELPGTRATPAAPGRERGLAARYGGDEFAMLLAGTGLDEAMRLAEHLRRAVEELLISHAGAPCGFLSISVGVASIVPGEHDSRQQLIEAADAWLYEAKQRGRNTVVAKSEVALLRAG
jgi:GGDEF domain-containing protein